MIFFLSGFSLMNIHESQDCREGGRHFLNSSLVGSSKFRRCTKDAWIQNFRMSRAKIKISNSKIHHSTRKTDNHHFAQLEGSMITFDEWKYL